MIDHVDDTGGRVKCRLQITIEIESGSVWNASTTMEQIKKQAIEGGLNRLAKIQRESGGIGIIGKPKVVAILVAEN